MYEALGSPLVLPFDPSKGISAGNGRVLYVSGLAGTHASDDNEGSDPQFPLATITAAVAKCTARRHDYIFVQDYYQGGDCPILINKRVVHLIGLGNGGPLPPRCLIEGETNNCIELDGDSAGVEIAGFQFGSVGADGIVMTAVAWQIHIHHCAFGETMAGQRGIYAPGPGASGQFAYGMVDNCWFGQSLTGNKIDVDSVRSSFNHNVFRVYNSIAIHIIRGDLGTILGNVFMSRIADALVAGWAIDLGGTVDSGIIAGNKASCNGQAGTTNPYRDHSSGNVATMLNGWADNFDGPALSGGPDVG